MPEDSANSSVRILRQLYLLRNITISFIVLMALLAVFGLGIRLPLLPLTIILLILAITNLITRWLIYSDRQITNQSVFIQLLIEILSFSLVLFFTGGATNPITFFYLIPLAIAATVIPGRPTWVLTGLTILFYSLLLKFYVPLSYRMHDHQHDHAADGQFSQHVIGMWFGFLVSAMLVTWFLTYLAKELKRRDHAIAEARQRELRDQQMVTLGTLAAGTAHELGSPLASMAVISGELTDGFDPEQYPELYENQQILKQQIARCKQILSVLSESAGEARAEEGYLIAAADFVDQVVEHWRQLRPEAVGRVQLGELPEQASLLYDQTISQALINLLNNAADAGTEPVEIMAEIAEQQLRLEILDRGQGISDAEIAMAGQTSFSSKPDGMGIGLYLAINTIRRSGGSVAFARRRSGGTRTQVSLPLIQQNHES
ncbi:MAG: HAMP domain-containing sensor histidine kinase [Gammaproteobacteria bacterium]|nr:HAMP domain-containing sensor histidine kinase [Gammaproteobacteria bacterium]